MQDLVLGFEADLADKVKSCMCRTWLLGFRLILLSKLSPARAGPACSTKVLHMQDLPVQVKAGTCRTCLFKLSPACAGPACSSKVLHMQDKLVLLKSCTCRTWLFGLRPTLLSKLSPECAGPACHGFGFEPV